MNGKAVLVVAILLGIVAGGVVTYFLVDSFTRVMVNGEAKALAERVRVVVADNGLDYNVSVDSPVARVIFWQTGGKLLAEDVWLDAAWQLVLGLEDKPTSSMQGDKADIILKIQKTSDGQVWFEVFCGGDYVKRIYFDNVLKLDTQSGTTRVRW